MKLANLIELIWDELYVCDQGDNEESKEDKGSEFAKPVNSSSKCKMIPIYIQFFC